MSAKQDNPEFSAVCAIPRRIYTPASCRTDIIKLFQNAEYEPAWIRSSILVDATRDVGLPLHEILAITDLMREAYADKSLDSLQQLLSLLALKTAHYASSLNSIIEAAKYDSAGKGLILETIDLLPLMQEVAQVTRVFLGSKPVSIMEVASSSPVLIRSDRTKIKQLVIGLMTNAAKFTNRGRVALILNKDDDRIRLTITDTGIGMTADQIKTLFSPTEPDVRAGLQDSAAPVRGIRMVMDLLTLLQGIISVSSKLGEGTIVEVSLPHEHAGSAATQDMDNGLL
jgi:signal transduction histidine kinase